MSVEQLKAQRKSKKQSVNKYEKRKKSIERIISNMDNKLDDEVSGINKKIAECISELNHGLQGPNQVKTIVQNMEIEKEKGVSSDSKLTSCRSNLSSELSRCKNKIDTLETEIQRIENDVKSQGGTIYFWE